jgi:hypothetical protein
VTVPAFLRLVVGAAVGLFVAALAVAAVVASRDTLAGVAVGGLLGTVNLFAISWLCARAIASRSGRWRYAVALAAKFALLIGVVWIAVAYVPMDIVGFVAGLSASAVAIVVATSYVAVRKLELEL